MGVWACGRAGYLLIHSEMSEADSYNSGSYQRDNNISPGSYGSISQSPQMSPANVPSPLMMSDHRRELSVLQTPQFILRQNPPSAGPTPTTAFPSGQTTPNNFPNGSIFDNSEQSQLSPHRPGTAPHSGSPGPDSYFPSEDNRRPSVASVATNASSTGSKSSMGRSLYNKFFGPGENEDGRSSETSTATTAAPRSHGFVRPSTPTGPPRPRTPVPSSEVVPFLYQDPDVRTSSLVYYGMVADPF